jgi:hypothetical protein
MLVINGFSRNKLMSFPYLTTLGIALNKEGVAPDRKEAVTLFDAKLADTQAQAAVMSQLSKLHVQLDRAEERYNMTTQHLELTVFLANNPGLDPAHHASVSAKVKAIGVEYDEKFGSSSGETRVYNKLAAVALSVGGGPSASSGSSGSRPGGSSAHKREESSSSSSVSDPKARDTVSVVRDRLRATVAKNSAQFAALVEKQAATDASLDKLVLAAFQEKAQADGLLCPEALDALGQRVPQEIQLRWHTLKAAFRTLGHPAGRAAYVAEPSHEAFLSVYGDQGVPCAPLSAKIEAAADSLLMQERDSPGGQFFARGVLPDAPVVCADGKMRNRVDRLENIQARLHMLSTSRQGDESDGEREVRLARQDRDGAAARSVETWAKKTEKEWATAVLREATLETTASASAAAAASAAGGGGDKVQCLKVLFDRYVLFALNYCLPSQLLPALNYCLPSTTVCPQLLFALN